MAQFSMEIMRLTGSVLRGNQQRMRESMLSPVIDEYAEKIGLDRSMLQPAPIAQIPSINQAIERYRQSMALYPITNQVVLAEQRLLITKSIIAWSTKCITYLDLHIDDAMRFSSKWLEKIERSEDVS